MHWVVTEPRDLRGRELLAILERTGTPHDVVRGGEARGTIVPDVDPAGPVLCFGSAGLRAVAVVRGWHPGAPSVDTLDHGACVRAWGDAMLNVDALVGTLDDLPALAAAVGSRDVFMRPARDDKAFDATRMAVDDVGAWVRGLLDKGLAPGTGAIAATAKRVLAEWRTWVVEGRVVATSLYRRGGVALFDGSDAPFELLDFAGARAADLETAIGPEAPVAYVLDACLTEDGMRVVEVNGICGARLYGCDVGRLFGALDGMGPRTPSPLTAP